MRIRIPLIERLRRRPAGTCPKCEHKVAPEQVYCEVCGYAIAEQAKVDVARIKPV